MHPRGQIGDYIRFGLPKRDLPPAVTSSIQEIRSCDLEVLDGYVEKRSKLGAPRKKFPEFNRDRDGGHALIGPIEVRGAEPGMSIEIKINEIIPGSWGGRPQTVSRATGTKKWGL